MVNLIQRDVLTNIPRQFTNSMSATRVTSLLRSSISRVLSRYSMATGYDVLLVFFSFKGCNIGTKNCGSVVDCFRGDRAVSDDARKYHVNVVIAQVIDHHFQTFLVLCGRW